MDQYLKSIDIFDSENTRFWTRFNLFTGFQFLLIAGFASGLDKLRNSPGIGILLIFVGLSCAIFNFLVVRRSLFTLRAITKVIDYFESKDENLVLLKKYKEYSKNELGGILKLCLSISLLLILFWIVFALFYMKMI